MDSELFFYAHIVFMIAAFLLILTGIATAVFLKRRRWWLKVHRTAGTLAAVCFLCGFTSAMAMVAFSTGEHFTVIHAWLGLTTTVLAMLTPALGYLRVALTGRKNMSLVTKGLRDVLPAAHRWSGRITLLLACATIALGMHVVGFF
jgi:hypothetical protein